MKEINYTQRDEHFSSNIHSYDKKKQARIAKNEFIDKIRYLLELAPLILCLVLAIPTFVLAIGLLIYLIVALFIIAPFVGIIVLLLCVGPIIVTYMAINI